MTSRPRTTPVVSAIPASVLAGTFLVALAGVALEVALVRVFALLFRYHHLFLLVSISICGLGFGGLVRTYLPDRWCRLWVAALLFGLSIPAALLLLFRSPLAGHLVDTPWLPLVPLLPFLFGGLFLSEAFRRYAAQGGALYFADLIGAALAALLVVPLLQWLGGIGTCFLIATLLCVGALILSGGPRARAACALAVVACLGLLATNQRLRLVDLPILPPDADPSLTKPLLRDAQPGSGIRIVATRWSAFARTDMTDEGDDSVRFLYSDGDTPTHMIRFDGDLEKVDVLRHQIGYLPYRLAKPESVLCIGPGGGMDVLLGLLGGARRIVGAEVNAEIIGLMEEYRDFNGSIYHKPGVDIHVADGRSFTKSRLDRFDLIYSALTQSATGSRAGVALAESYIHTKEAFADYLDHLTENGTYALILQEESVLARAFATAVAVLSERGESATEASRHLIAASIPEEARFFTPYRRILLVRRSPFKPAEAEQAMETMVRMGLHPVFVPHVLDNIRPFGAVATGQQSLDEFVAGFAKGPLPMNIAPCTDDRPFFLDLSTAMPPAILQLLWGVGLATLVAGTWLGVRQRRRGARAVARGISGALFFAILGMGFMLVEVPLIQQFILFLGHPVRSMTLVLFALLLGTAAGSRWSQRWATESLPARVAVAAGSAALLALLYRAVLGDLFWTLLPLPLLLREAATVLLLLPLGVFLGVPFPSGIRWVERDDSGQVPWLWGMNGLASVFGSVAAMALARQVGFSAALLAGACVYLCAAAVALMAHGAKPLPTPAATEEPPIEVPVA